MGGVKRHRAFRYNAVYRQPPIQLRRVCRIPGITVRMMSVADAGGEIAMAGDHAQARHIYKRLQAPYPARVGGWGEA